MGDEEDVRDALRALDEAFERRDLGAIGELCVDDFAFFGSGEGEEALGRAELLTKLAALGPQAKDVDFKLQWEAIDVDIQGDTALLVGVGKASLVSPRRTATTHYRLTGVLLRTEEGWRWRLHHGSEPAAW